MLEYDGTGLCGWQRQENGPTVQQHLEDVLTTLLGHDVRVAGASRTDAGVHALGQVASFTTTATTIPVHGIQSGANGMLPASIAIVAADEVSAEFHARFSARGKRYRYTVLARPERSPVRSRFAWHRTVPLNIEAMRRAAELLVGEHDFSAFRAVGCQAKTTVRTIRRIHVAHPADDAVVIEIEGTAFLRNMVRIIAGTLVEVGEARRDFNEIAEILANGDRVRAGQTAPAQGLTLVEVIYDEDV